MATGRFHRFMRVCPSFLVCLALVLTPFATDAIDIVPPPFVLPPIKHVFTIILENQSFNNTFGPGMPTPYLAKTVAGKGALLQQYYGTSHFSLGNYVSLVSGQAVTRANQDDCAPSSQYPELSVSYSDVQVKGMAPYDQVMGDGCIYPAATKTIGDQLTAAGLTWHGYMEDLGNDSTRETVKCGQPINGVGAPDQTQLAQTPPAYHAGGDRAVSDQYAAKHNPFVYFHSLLDNGACQQHVGALGTPEHSPLVTALRSIATTPNYVFITPNLCNDGHDTPCKAPNSPVGVHAYEPEDAFLRRWVPIIVRSPAFMADGLLIITFDESSMSGTSPSGVFVGYDGSGCCNEPSGPNTATPGVPPLAAPQYYHIPVTTGANGISGGGLTGTVLVSPFIPPGIVSSVPYNHYNTLRTLEDVFGLKHLGYADYPGTIDFGIDVFGRTPTRGTIEL